jgi:predicted RNA-binding protein with TRAM domain
MKLLHIILFLALAAILVPLLTAMAKQSGRTLLANSRELADNIRANRFDVLAGNTAALNDHSKIFMPFSGDGPHGLIMAANDANFDAAHLSEPLTEYIVDTPDDEGLDVLLDQAFPSVPVGRSFSYRVHDTKESFQAALNDEDIREIGGEFAQIRRTGTQADGRTDNKGLVMILDNDQGGEEPAVQQRAVSNLRNRLLRTELYRGEALLEANDVAVTPNWGVTNTAADPDGDLVYQNDVSGDLRGIDSNVALYGGSAWVTRFLSLGLGDNAARHQTRNLTPAQLAELAGLEKVLKSKFRYQSSGTAKAKVIGAKVYLYYAKAGAMADDPSNIKRFITSVPGGGMFRVYIEARLKRTLVAVEHYSRLVLTSSVGIRKIAPTYT